MPGVKLKNGNLTNDDDEDLTRVTEHFAVLLEGKQVENVKDTADVKHGDIQMMQLSNILTPVTRSSNQDTTAHVTAACCGTRYDRERDLDCGRRQTCRALERAPDACRYDWNHPAAMEDWKTDTTLQEERRRCRLQYVSRNDDSRSCVQGDLLAAAVTDCASDRNELTCQCHVGYYSDENLDRLEKSYLRLYDSRGKQILIDAEN